MSWYKFATLRRCLSWFWRTLDASRRIFFNLLFLLFLVALVLVFAGGGMRRLKDNTALVLDLKGDLVEQYPGGVHLSMLSHLKEDEKQTVQLRDVLTVLDAAAKDPKISSVVLILDEFRGAGMPMLRDVALALDRVKASGKVVVAWGSNYDQRQYFLAVHANQVWLDPMGMVGLEGFGGYRNYYRDALDKLGITVNVMRVGAYKSFAEPYTDNGPSAEAIEAESALYNNMWSNYTSTVEAARKLPTGSVMQIIDNLPQLMTAARGNTAELALAAKLVDGLKTRDELRHMMIARGVKDEQTHSFRQISFDDYLARQNTVPATNTSGDAIGVIIAAGEIGADKAPAGSIGGVSTSNLIRMAREDDHVKALVLRVDSPGGSAFGAELIRRELELTRKAGKPVVVSMGDVAASGGYWISMSADEVIADPATVTGSIGVFALLPTADKAMEKIGVHSAGVTTTWLRGGYDPFRPLDPRFRDLIQSGIAHIYDDFTAKAAAARKTSVDKIDAVAQGRVWSGQQAKERGLLDSLGSYDDALKSAARRARLGDDYRVAYIEREPTGVERIVRLFDTKVAQALVGQFDFKSQAAVQIAMQAGIAQSAASEVGGDFNWLTDIVDNHQPFAAVTHCFCRQP